MANIKARRKLSDLYAVGVPVRFDTTGGRVGPFVDGDGNPIPLSDGEVEVWVTPPSPLQREQAMRDAQAARAKALLRAKRDKDSQEYLSQEVFVADLSDESLLEYLMVVGAEERRSDAQRDVLAFDEWENIDALQDAMRQYQELDEPPVGDPEYDALMEADARYGEQVAKREQELADAERESYGTWTREGLERKAKEKRSELIGSQAWMTEYERQMQFYSVRDPEDHGVLFFESARELANSSEEVQAAIITALSKYITDAVEAKKAPTVAPGSESSERPNEQETSESSTPETVNE